MADRADNLNWWFVQNEASKGKQVFVHFDILERKVLVFLGQAKTEHGEKFLFLSKEEVELGIFLFIVLIHL